MAYDPKLVERIRAILSSRKDVVEKKMFGGVAFMVAGNMACGPNGDDLIVRIGNEAGAKVIGRPNVKPMAFTGRPMKSFATIEPAGMRTDAQLRRWVEMAVAYAVSLPPGGKKKKRATSAAGSKKAKRSGH